MRVRLLSALVRALESEETTRALSDDDDHSRRTDGALMNNQRAVRPKHLPVMEQSGLDDK